MTSSSDPKKTPMPADADREIVLSRLLDAPRALVWKVWTDPEHVREWWGPQGFSTTTSSMEVKPGGSWRFVMHGPDGRDYENLISYVDVVEPDRLSYTHGGALDSEPVNFSVTVTFESVGDGGEQTLVTMRSLFPSAEARDFVIRECNAVEGGKQTLSRLGDHLASMALSDASRATPPFVVRRVIDAPIERVFSLWTDPEHLRHWFSPAVWKLSTCSLDLRVGGVFHYCMSSPDMPDMWGRWVFREITPPTRLVFAVSFSNETGGVERAPFDEQWPLEMLSTVTLAQHAGIGRGTLVTLESTALDANPEEQRKFEDGYDSMNQGWTETLNSLSRYIASV